MWKKKNYLRRNWKLLRKQIILLSVHWKKEDQNFPYQRILSSQVIFILKMVLYRVTMIEVKWMRLIMVMIVII